MRNLLTYRTSFSVRYISEDNSEDFEELAKLYELLGLSITIEYDKVKVSAKKYMTLINLQLMLILKGIPELVLNHVEHVL